MMAAKSSTAGWPIARVLRMATLVGATSKSSGYMKSSRISTNVFHPTPWRWLALLILASTVGCYDGNELLKQAQSTALSTTLAEVDLGKFQTTLPRDPSTGRFIALDLHIFGTVPRSRLSAVQEQLENDEYRMRHETLSA